jgi:c-di-GMP-binding flagellar brake protein YcgR
MNPPSHPPTSTAPQLELLQPQDFSAYLLRSRAEILPVLRALRDHHALVTLHIEGADRSLLTAILGVDENGMALDSAREPAVNAEALASPRLIAAASQDKVKVQFPVGPLKQGLFQGREAFAAPLPDRLLRLQRREYYRLTTPSARPLRCRIPLPTTSGPHRHADANIIDIGGGGLALMAPPEGIAFEAGMEFQHCRVDLPDVGIVVANLLVRSTFAMATQGGLVVKRAGCQFIELPGPMLTLIQRYIIRTERERKARAAAEQ